MHTGTHKLHMVCIEGGTPQRARVLSWRVGEGTRGVGTARQQPRTTHSLFLIASHQCALGNVFGLMWYIRRDECLVPRYAQYSTLSLRQS